MQTLYFCPFIQHHCWGLNIYVTCFIKQKTRVYQEKLLCFLLAWVIFMPFTPFLVDFLGQLPVRRRGTIIFASASDVWLRVPTGGKQVWCEDGWGMLYGANIPMSSYRSWTHPTFCMYIWMVLKITKRYSRLWKSHRFHVLSVLHAVEF